MMSRAKLFYSWSLSSRQTFQKRQREPVVTHWMRTITQSGQFWIALMCLIPTIRKCAWLKRGIEKHDDCVKKIRSFQFVQSGFQLIEGDVGLRIILKKQESEERHVGSRPGEADALKTSWSHASGWTDLESEAVERRLTITLLAFTLAERRSEEKKGRRRKGKEGGKDRKGSDPRQRPKQGWWQNESTEGKRKPHGWEPRRKNFKGEAEVTGTLPKRKGRENHLSKPNIAYLIADLGGMRNGDFRGHDGQQGDKVQGQQTQADEDSNAG